MLLSIGSWFSQNWMLLLVIGILVLYLAMSFMKQKKEMNNRNELVDSIKKGTKIVTTAGVYGVVESIENTTDGKVVTIRTGNAKAPATMTIHINAIMGIDNKSLVKEDTKVVEETNEDEVSEEVNETVTEETPKTTTKKSTTKKTTKK